MKITLKLLSIILFPFLIGISMPDKDPATTYETDNFNPEKLDGAFTGGFGEQTCRSCHFDYELNREGGSLEFLGPDDSFQPGQTYDITVTVESEQLEIGGFQMTARFEDGTQAGSFNWRDDGLMFTPSLGDSVQYIQHSENGTSPTEPRKISWAFTWQAPDAAEMVLFNIAANAGNYDDSAFGDWIYVKEIATEPETK